MTAPVLSRRRLLVAASCAVPLAACSLLPDPPQAQIYRLHPRSDDPPNAAVLRSQLAIDVPTVPQSLDTDRIALTRGGTRFDYFADSVWTDRVPVLLQNLLVQAFESSGRAADVGRDMDTMLPGYMLQTDVRDFQASYAAMDDHPPVVVINLALRLVRTPDRRTVGFVSLQQQETAVHNDLDSVVRAFDAAAGSVLDRGVDWVLCTAGRR